MESLDPDLELIFVSGPPRSGTTLLAGMIAGGDAYPMLPECTFMTAAVRTWDTIRTYGDPIRKSAFVGPAERLDDLFRPVITGFVTNAVSLLDCGPRRHLILKDPELTPFLKDMPRFFSNRMKSIVTVRDPRDVVASLLKARKISVRTAIHVAHEHYRYIRRAVAEAPAANPVLLVRYEDIARKDARTMDQIDAFLGYSMERGGYREVARPFDRSDGTFSDLYGKSVSASRVGAAKASLSPLAMAMVETAFADFIRQYGYPEPRHASVVKLVRWARRRLGRHTGAAPAA